MSGRARQTATACVLGLVTAFAAARADAQTTFTDRAAWAAAAGSHVTVDFEGFAPPGGSAAFPVGLTLSGVTFRGAGSAAPLSVEDSASAVFISAWGSGDMAMAPFGFGTQASPAGSITLPAGVAAVGFNYAVTCSVTLIPSCGSLPWTVRLSTGAVLTIPGSNPPPTMAFWGVVSPVAIGSLQIEASASLALLDNFSFAPAAVPALPPWGLAALAALLLAIGARSIRRRASA